jgi:uncharacterized membrane protein YcaP (DUF421 family)
VRDLTGWNFLFDWLAYRYSWFQRLLEPKPLPIVRDGTLLRRNMRHEFITADEVMSQLREQGVDDVSEVKLAYVEPDGGVSVIKRHSDQSQHSPSRDNEALR